MVLWLFYFVAKTMSKKLTWKIERRKLSDLKPLEKNPFGKSTPEKLERLKKKLDNLGVFETPTIDTDNNLLSFNKRHHALMTLWGADAEIDCMVPGRKLTESERKEIILASNAHEGEWDLELLREDFADIDLDNLGLNLDVMEFERSDHFDKAMKRFVTTTKNTLEAQEDNYDIPDEIKTDIVPGDLFEIGQHRLLCGDSTDSDAVAKLMGGEKADMVLTDPPYGVSYSDKNKFLNRLDKGNRNQTEISNDHLSKDDMKSFWKIAFVEMNLAMRPGAAIYCFMPQGGDQMMMMMMMYDAGIEPRHELIWLKNNHVLGRVDYAYKHEPILYAWKKGGHKFYGGFQTSILEFPKPLRSDLHPTMKPVDLLMNLILNSSLENHSVLDPFLGSGSTMVAAHQLNRRCFGMELDPKYCQVIIDRMIKLEPEITIKRNGVPYDHNSRQLQQQPDADTSTPEITS